MDPISLITVALPLVLKYAPKLLGLFAGPTAGTAAGQVIDAAKETFGTIEHDKIELQIQQDKSKLAAFQAAADERTKETQAFLADVQSARAMTTALAQAQSPMAWGSPIITGIVTLGFFVILAVLITRAFDLPEYQRAITTTLIGYLGACFQQAVNFWLGSSKDSQNKTAMIGSLAGIATAGAQATAEKVTTAAAKTTNGSSSPPPSGRMFK